MASRNRRGGVINVQTNGEVLDAVGSFTYNLGQNKREMLPGADRIHGFKEMPQVPFIEGEVRDSGEFNMTALLNTVDATITLTLANGKTIMLREATFTGEGSGATEEGTMPVRFEGLSAEEI